MSTRKPFSIRTQNELNISNKENLVNKKDITIKKNITKKIINVKTKTNSKIYINKKEVSIANAPAQEVKKIEDVENHAPAQEQPQVEKVAVSTPEVDMSRVVSSRITYTPKQLLSMMPNVCPAPPGFENWPEALRNPKPKSTKKLPTVSNSPFKTPLVQKRSPMGEVKEKIAITTTSEPVVPVIKMPEIIIPSIKLETLPTSSPSKAVNIETDERRLEQRQKQIDLGKKTLSYYMYTKKVPALQRKKGCPITPRKNQVCSKRSWDGQVRKWRRMLHDYDPKTPEEIEEAMKLFPEETKYLLQKRKDGEDVDNIEEDHDDSDDVSK